MFQELCYYLEVREKYEVFADQRAAVLVVVGQTKMSFICACLNTSMLIIEINHTRYLKHRAKCTFNHYTYSWKIGGLGPIFNFKAFHVIAHDCIHLWNTSTSMIDELWLLDHWRPAFVEIADVDTLSHLAKFGGNLSRIHTFSWMFNCMIPKNNSTMTCKAYCVMQICGIQV